MIMPYINCDLLRKKLEKMDEWHQLAFGAACCERMFPYYEQFCKKSGWGNEHIIRQSLDVVWSALNGIVPNVRQMKHAEQNCFEVTPDSDEFGELDGSLAQRAGIGVCYLLKYCQRSDVNYILEIANVSIEGAYLFVVVTEDINATDPKFDEKILHHEVMQRELRHQNIALIALKSASAKDTNLLHQLKLGLLAS